MHCLMPLNFKSCAYIIIPKCVVKSNKIKKKRRERKEGKRVREGKILLGNCPKEIIPQTKNVPCKKIITVVLNYKESKN